MDFVAFEFRECVRDAGAPVVDFLDLDGGTAVAADAPGGLAVGVLFPVDVGAAALAGRGCVGRLDHL